MAKSNEIEKLVNGQVADGNIVNQIIENAGTEGGAIPYDPDSHQRDTLGDESLGNTSYPWGSFCINRDAYLMEIETSSNTVANQVAIKDLRKFISQKDTPNSMTGQGNKYVRVKSTEDGLEFVSVESDYQDGTLYTEATASTLRQSTTSTSYQKLKEFSPMIRPGTISVQWETQIQGGVAEGYSKVYVNGVAVGTQKSTTNTGTFDTVTDTGITVETGDIVQIYATGTTQGYATRIQNAEILCNNPTIPQEVSGY